LQKKSIRRKLRKAVILYEEEVISRELLHTIAASSLAAEMSIDFTNKFARKLKRYQDHVLRVPRP